MFTYLTASVAARLAAMAMEDGSNAEYCTAIAFLRQYTSHIVLCCNIGAIVYLLHHVRKSSPGQQRTRYSMRLRFSLELGFVLFTILFPLTYNWVPFLHNAYGGTPGNPYCWLRSKNSDCSKINAIHWYFITLVEVPLAVTLFLNATLVCIIAGVYCKWAYKYRNVKEVRSTLLREACATSLLVVYFLVYSLCYFFLAAIYGITPFMMFKSSNYRLWIAGAIIDPLSGLSVPVSFVAYLYLRRKEIKRSRRGWNCCKINSSEREEQLTFHRSVPIHVPSSTCPYIPVEFNDECSKNLMAPQYVNGYGSCTDRV